MRAQDRHRLQGWVSRGVDGRLRSKHDTYFLRMLRHDVLCAKALQPKMLGRILLQKRHTALVQLLVVDARIASFAQYFANQRPNHPRSERGHSEWREEGWESRRLSDDDHRQADHDPNDSTEQSAGADDCVKLLWARVRGRCQRRIH